MKNDNLISNGANLKRIRKDLNLKQYEIAGEDITRNLISLMENDKTPLCNNTANIIARNINKIIAERGSYIYIQPEDILNPQRYEARKKANIYIKKLKKILESKNYEISVEKLNEIESFLNQWCFIDKKVQIYDLLGDIYYEVKDLNKEYYYYIKALEVSYGYENMKNRYKIILKLVYNCIVTEKHEEAIQLCNFALSTQNDIPMKYKGIFYYNSALAYYHLDAFNKSLEQLINAKYYITYDDYRDIKKILILEGICNCEIKNYNGALRHYDKLLDILDIESTFDEKSLAYINIMQVYIKKDNREKVIEYHNKIMNYLPFMDESSFYLPELLFSISKTYYYLEEYETCEEYLNRAILLSTKHKDTGLFSKFLSSLLDLYIKLGWFDKIDALTETFGKQILNFNFNEDFNVILKLLDYYVDQNNNEEVKCLIKNLLNKKERCN